MGLVAALTNKLLEALTFCPLSLLCDYSFLLNDLPFSLLLLKSKAQGFSDIYNNFFLYLPNPCISFHFTEGSTFNKMEILLGNGQDSNQHAYD